MDDHHSTNGLVDGNVPAGQACPFAGRCDMLTRLCPTKGAMRTGAYSCAAARWHSLVRNERADARRGE